VTGIAAGTVTVTGIAAATAAEITTAPGSATGGPVTHE